MKMIDKESLNMEKCRQDLLYGLKGEWFPNLVFFLSVTMMTGFLYLIGGLAFASSDILRRIIALLWLIPAGYFIGYVTYAVRKWLWITKTPFSVVEDTLCGTEAIMRDRGACKPPILRHWEIHFSGHGVYKTTLSHATWSRKGNRMNCSALANSSDTGDKFYLLLDERSKKGEKPKIILSYPCKYFQWQGEIV